MNDQHQAPDSRPPTPVPTDNTASLGKRFGAFLLDTLFLVIAMSFLLPLVGLGDIDPSRASTPEAMQAALLEQLAALSAGQKILLVSLPVLAFLALHGYLLSRYGQTLGKRMLGIAIVTLDNRVPDFFPLIIQRYLTQWVAGQVPVVGVLLRLVDVIFIFRPDRRCIHDHLAKTKVIDLSIPISVSETPAVPSNSLIV